MAAKLHTDFLALFDDNLLVEPGAYEALDAPVDLSEVTCDMFIVGAVTDHLTPWKACYKSGRLIGGERTFALSNGGHVAALVNPPGNPKAYHFIAPATPETADEWMETAEKMPGSWWESWTKWCGTRSGKLIPAPKALGSKAFPPLMDAPGDYVRQ
jgi:polyhydroxyalkanoate synthase